MLRERASMLEEMECCSAVKYGLLVFLVLFSTAEINGAQACNSTSSALSGTYEATDYYNVYCYNLISVPPGYRITIEFQLLIYYFDLKIYDGNSTAATSLGQYAGSKVPPFIHSTGNQMLVRFNSWFFSSEHLRYSYFSVWNQAYTALSGTFRSPNYPSSYGNNQEVVYLISLPPGYRITLTIQVFRLENRASTGCYDFMEIFDGNSSASPSFGRFCGTTKPADMRSTHHEMFIRFHSDKSTYTTGFNASYSSACDRNFTALTGNLRSPNYPSGYMNNQDCSFLITVPPDYSISLTFQHFNLQSNSSSGCLDYVEIFDGRSSTAPSLGRLCGPKELTEDKRTTRNEMLVHFYTDSSLAFSGFDASYHSDCDRVLTTLTGSLHSPGFPSTYSNNQDCDFLISVPRGYRIALTFLNFSLEAGSSVSDCHDFVEVFDGNSRRAPLLGRYCGTEAPSDDMRTTRHEMLVRFHTDNTNTFAGFNASYSSDCHMTFTAPLGSFYYPDYQPNHGNDQDCDYVISVAPGNRITVKFHNIGLESGGTIDDDCSSLVEIFDGNSTMAPSLGRYCGTGQAEVNQTTWNQMLVRFHSDGSVPSPRFYSTYSSVNASLTIPPDSSANSGSDVNQNVVIVGGSVGGFALVLAVALVILVVLFVRRTDRKEAEPLALSEIHARPTSNAYLSDTKRETEQEEEDIYENTVDISDENPEGVYCEPAPSRLPQNKTTGQRRLRDNTGGAAQSNKPAREDKYVLPSQPAVQEPQFPCEGDYEGLCRTQADADVNEYVLPPQPASREPAKYPEEDLYMNM